MAVVPRAAGSKQQGGFRGSAIVRGIVEGDLGMPQPGRPESAGPKLSSSAGAALEIADAVRRAAGHGIVTSEMVLYGLASKPNGAAHNFIRARIGRDPAAAIAEDFKLVAAEPTADPQTPESLDALPYSANVERVLQIAASHATHNVIRDRHVFAAMLEVPGSRAFQWLQRTLEPEMPLDWVREALREWPPDDGFSIDEVRRRLDAARITLARSAFSDAPAVVDRLDFDTHARALADIIVKPETRPPVVVGVYGPWGSGKSTLLELVERELKLHAKDRTGPAILTIRYNAWAYTDAARLWAGLVKAVSKALDARLSRWQKLRYALTRRGARFAAAAVTGLIPLAGVALATSMHWAAGAAGAAALVSLLGVAGYGSVERRMRQLTAGYDRKSLDGVMGEVRGELQAIIQRFFVKDEPELQAQIRQGKLKVVVFIDELDRCPLDRIVDILEAIKLFLAEEIFIVLLAIDTRVAAEAIHRHYKDVATPQLAREYLEKIVQIPIHVPRPAHIESLLHDLMSIQVDRATAANRATPEPANPQAPQRALSRRLAGSRAALVAVDGPPSQPTGEAPRIRVELPDTEHEFKLLAELSSGFLHNNPRRLKRVLNTYRYVKLLSERRGRTTRDPAWQRRTLAWLVFTQVWPDFMLHAVEAAAGASQDLVTSLAAFRGEKPSEANVKEFLQLTPTQIAELADDAGNFLFENPPRRVALDDGDLAV
jgi:hypothetical protein